MTTEPLEATVVTSLVRDATAAPSVHNSQPWRFRYLAARCAIRLFGDPERAMARSDPHRRALHLGCGAALFNLRVAAARAGREPDTVLLPDPADPWLLAEVRLDRPVRADDDLAVLHPAIHRRHTSRFPFTGEDIPAGVLDGLRAAARMEGARLRVPGAWHVQEVLHLLHDAESRESLDPEAREELRRWTGMPGSDSSGEGVPANAFGPRQHDVTAPVRDFAAGRTMAGRGSATFEKRPRLVLLGTSHDGPVDWLTAGQALERVLLQATLDGLVTSLTSQAMEWPELRWALRDPASSMGHVQMVIRLGYGPEGPKTPRRPVEDVLELA
ncbi:nitroreductase [Streptomyces sp. PKU-MA01144]|uniref:Acg family FMN-binding oxidoreductase n=1 Tax=Streptomyces sp. PKU-MA01144 TaxID=2729138 RepID=UPI0003649ACE|nr:nitroreductase family protein [Streptomyces sp. PKU-MA01144]NNJ05304.1 nitroreductase [Streptomyces sp. PKU-MA01144]